MRNAFITITAFAIIGLSTSQNASAQHVSAAESGEIEDVVAIEKIGERRFRLINNSEGTLVFLHWLNQSPQPVAYCKQEDDSISICSKDRYFDSSGKPALQEGRLKPGKSVTFDAMKAKAVAIGVRLRIDGEDRLFWHEL